MSAEEAESPQDAQRRAWRRLTPQQRLEWLQQAKEFSRRFLGAAARRAPVTPKPSPVK